MSADASTTLGQLVDRGEVLLGRGDVISANDIAATPGPYPIYSSSAQGNGEFGKYGRYMFDEELITWSVDGGGRAFHRPRHRFSVTNVCGYLRILDRFRWDYRYLHAAIERQHARITFDYQMKAHPSVIKDLYQFQPRPIAEQRQIASVLDTVDEAIRRTEQIIAKQTRIKQGLLHDLLTRGINHNGELRDPLRHPEQFKDSALGRIPKEWEVAPVEALLAPVSPAMRSGPFGSALLKSELVERGIPLLGIDNVHAERFERTFTRFVTPQKAAELSRYFVRSADVMITIMGTVGRCCVVPDDIGQALSSKHVWTLTFDASRYSSYLACAQITHAPWALRHLARDEQGGIMAAIRSETLRTMLLPVPPISEASRIASILRSQDERATREATSLAKLRLLKAGLMEDLLTGRVRVAALLGGGAR